MIMRRIILMLSLFIAQPADAGCFLFFCSWHRHHHHRHAHVVLRKTVVKKIIIVRERKAHVPPADQPPITPLK
jgi:hypothetical protein